MKSFLVALLVFVSVTSQAQQLRGQIPVGGMTPVKNFLLPFQSDGCTGWIDKSIAGDFTSCCLDHDISYWIGGTEKQKLETDLALQKCVGKKAYKLMGTLMFVFVWMWGKLDSKDVTRWANGWNFLRERYQPVTEEEKHTAIQMTPPDLTSALKKYWSKEKRANTKIETYQAEPYPTVLGNYCLDEFAGKLSRKVIELGRKDFNFTYQPHDDFKTSYSIRTNLCKEEIIVHYNVINLSQCTDPVWGIRPSNYLKDMISYGDCEKLLNSLKAQQ